MQKITATKLRNNLFHYLDRVKAGEILIIFRNKNEVARIVPPQKQDWRMHTTVEIKLKVSPEELIKPLDDIWEKYQ